MKAIVAGSEQRERLLFALLGATGIRIGEALGIEMGKHISEDFSTLHIRQKVWHGSVQPFLKTENAVRDLDIYSAIATLLKRYVGSRTSGFLFCSKSGRPLLQSNLSRLPSIRFSKNLGNPKRVHMRSGDTERRGFESSTPRRT
jgi:site-specific recombinase XerD